MLTTLPRISRCRVGLQERRSERHEHGAQQAHKHQQRKGLREAGGPGEQGQSDTPPYKDNQEQDALPLETRHGGQREASDEGAHSRRRVENPQTRGFYVQDFARPHREQGPVGRAEENGKKYDHDEATQGPIADHVGEPFFDVAYYALARVGHRLPSRVHHTHRHSRERVAARDDQECALSIEEHDQETCDGGTHHAGDVHGRGAK